MAFFVLGAILCGLFAFVCTVLVVVYPLLRDSSYNGYRPVLDTVVTFSFLFAAAVLWWGCWVFDALAQGYQVF